jgi:hypothetical protein
VARFAGVGTPGPAEWREEASMAAQLLLVAAVIGAIVLAAAFILQFVS